MADLQFAPWLARKSWDQAVRFSILIAWLLPPAALAVHAPGLRDPRLYADPAWRSLLAWHVTVELTCLAVLLVDRAAPALRGREATLNVFCALVMVLCTWGGIAGWQTMQDFALYSLGTTFIATAVCTPRPVRRPMYVLSILAIVAAVQAQVQDGLALLAVMANPVAVAVICDTLDRYVFERHAELHAEQRRTEAERARADAVLYNVLPAAVADQLKREQRAGAAKYDNMGVLFADIAGFTQFSRSLPPDALVFILNQIFSAFDALVERHGVEKIKTIGDAYMVASPAGAAPLARLALDMFEAMERYNAANGTRLQMRAGMHVGPAVAGIVGTKRFLYDVWGDTVNIASRMESSGEPGTIQTTEAVYLQLRERFLFERGGPRSIKGQGTLPVYLLMGPVRQPAAQCQAVA